MGKIILKKKNKIICCYFKKSLLFSFPIETNSNIKFASYTYQAFLEIYYFLENCGLLKVSSLKQKK